MNSYLKIVISTAVGLTCASGQIHQPDQPQDLGVTTLRVHRTWTTFFHPRSGYELPIPPGVRATGHPEAENEPQFQSADQNFVMSAWGGMASENPSQVMTEQWNSSQRKANRVITYQSQGKTWFVISGTDIRGIEFYEKFTMRGQHVAFLDIRYPKSHIRQYEPWVEQIEGGFRTVSVSGGPPEYPQLLSRGREEVVIETTPTEQIHSTLLPKTGPAPKPESKLPDLELTRLPKVVVTSSANRLPSAYKVVGKPGYVYSPFSADNRIVDVVGMPSGTKAKCPYTMKIFRVP